MARGQVPIVRLTELVLTCQGRGRVHVLRLMKDAFDRQVLRQAGTVYQFRHAALQDRLAGTCYQEAPTFLQLVTSLLAHQGGDEPSQEEAPA